MGIPQAGFQWLLLALQIAMNVFGGANIYGQRVGVVGPNVIESLSIRPASPTSAIYTFVDRSDNEEGFYAEDLSGVIKAVFPANESGAAAAAAAAPAENTEVNLEPNTIYDRKVCAYNLAGKGDYLQGKFCTYALSPSNFRAGASGAAGLELAWSSQNYVRYKLMRSEAFDDGSFGPDVVLAGDNFNNATGNNTFIDNTAGNVKRWRYTVQAYNQLGDLNPYGSQILAAYNRLSPDFSQIRFSFNRAPGQNLRARDPIGPEILIKAEDLNPGGLIKQIVVTSTNTKTGQKYITRIDAQVTSASADGYYPAPTNYPQGNYDLEIMVLNDSGLSATKTINVNKYDSIQVLGGMAVVVPKGMRGGALSVKDVGAADFATIGYMLTLSGDVQIQILDSGGQTMMKKVIPANLEGARVGPNEVPWNGITLSGSGIGRGLYLGQIISGGKIIGRFAFPVQ